MECLGTLGPEVKEAPPILPKHLQRGGPYHNKCVVIVMSVHGCHLAGLQSEVPNPLSSVLMYEVGANISIHLAPGTLVTGRGWAGGQAGGAPLILAGGDTASQAEGAGCLAGRGPEQGGRVSTGRRGSGTASTASTASTQGQGQAQHKEGGKAGHAAAVHSTLLLFTLITIIQYKGQHQK